MIELQKSNGGRRGAPAREDLPPPPITERAAPGPPPTIGHLRSMGMTHLTLTCAAITCRRQKHLAFDDLRLPDDALFPAIENSRKFVCSGCGGRKVEAFPDWSTVRGLGVRAGRTGDNRFVK